MLNIADRRELFVDSLLIDQLDHARLIMHHPQWREQVFHFDKPWEGWGSAYPTVLEDEGQYRLYYRGGPNDDFNGGFCMATSDDGIHWTRPNLGLVEFQGSTDNNLLFTRDLWNGLAPFVDRNPNATPDQRYKALVMIGHDGVPGTISLGAAASPDGIHWTPMQDEPVLTQGAFDSHNIAFWSETEGCYVAYFRVYSKHKNWREFLGRRTIARATSDDFIHWSEPVMMDFGDMPTEQHYTNGTTPYFRAPHIYIALASRYVLGRNTPLSKDQLEALAVPETQRFISDAVLMTTRGGHHYDRTFKQAFFRPGTLPGNWTSRSNMPSWGILPTSDTEMSIYFTQRYAQQGNHLLRTTLRTDGFSSINAGYEQGQILTRPFIFKGSKLELNMATSGVGSIRVEIQNPQGQPFRDFALADSYEHYGDEINKPVKWQGSTDVSALAGQPVRLRIEIKDADLYALKFSDDPL